MLVSAGHVCVSACVHAYVQTSCCVCVRVSFPMPSHCQDSHPTSTPLWWVYQMGISCQLLLLRLLLHTTSTSCSFLYCCLAQIRIQDNRCRFIALAVVCSHNCVSKKKKGRKWQQSVESVKTEIVASRTIWSLLYVSKMHVRQRAHPKQQNNELEFQDRQDYLTTAEQEIQEYVVVLKRAWLLDCV